MLDLSGEVNLTSHLSYKWATGMRESSLQPFLAETRRDTKARERQDKLFVQHIKIDSNGSPQRRIRLISDLGL